MQKRSRISGSPVYALEKFSVVVRGMATGPGDVRSRLEGAFVTFHTIRAEDLPPSLRRRFRSVVRALTRREARREGEGKLHASLAQMQNRTGAAIARKIVEIDEGLRLYCENEDWKKRCKAGRKRRAGRAI